MDREKGRGVLQNTPENPLIVSNDNNTAFFDNNQAIIEKDLNKSGLTLSEVKDYGWYIVKRNLKNIIGFGSIERQDIMQATQAVLAIPYPNTKFNRVRLYPAIGDCKYLQPKEIPPKPYIVNKIAKLKDKINKPVIFTEGEKKTLCLIKNGYNAIGLPGVWQFKNQKQGFTFLPELEAWSWKERTVHICFDSDTVNNANVIKAEIELGLNLYAKGAKVYVIRLPQPDHQTKYGVDDYIAAVGIEAFKKQYEEAKLLFDAYSFAYYQEVIKRIAELYNNGVISNGQLEFITTSLHKSWEIKKSSIDKDIENLTEPKEEQLKQSIIEDLEPYEGTVNGVELADKIESILKRYVYLKNNNYYTAITLWIFLTYIYDKFGILPMLLITSPTMRCGKTTLLEILEGLTNKALSAGSISPAAVYRTVEKYKATLLIDEADTGLAQNEELRGIINAGHTKRTAFVIRSGDKTVNFDPERFNTYCPKVIAMIGKPAGTWIDRSIHIRMERKTGDIRIAKRPSGFYEAMRPLRQKLLKWACSDLVPFEKNYNLTNDRAVDNWKPLLEIANSLNNEWLLKAEKAMIDMENDNSIEDSLNVELLKDIEQYFEKEEANKVFSKSLVNYLCKLEERPWADLRRGNGLTQNILARMLKPFDIVSKTIRIEADRAKGYELSQFKKTFKQYLPPYQKRDTVTMAPYIEKSAKQSVTQDNLVTDRNTKKVASQQGCHVVTDRNDECTDNKIFSLIIEYMSDKKYDWTLEPEYLLKSFTAFAESRKVDTNIIGWFQTPDSLIKWLDIHKDELNEAGIKYTKKPDSRLVSLANIRIHK